MQISGETNKLDLYSEARDWCGIPTTDTTTLTLATFVRSANFGLDRVESLILRANNIFDDNNQTDSPISTDSLVSGQQSYSLSITFLRTGRVRAKDSAGNWETLTPVERRELNDAQLEETGDPKMYFKKGKSIYLVPTPDYASSEGLEVGHQRGAVYIAYDATTTVPGFDSDFHILIAFYGARDYCEKNGLTDRAKSIREKIGSPPTTDGQAGFGLENELLERYTSKNIEKKVTLQTTTQDYGQMSDTLGGGYSNNPDGF